MRLQDKVALITGGGSGIGAATVLRFAEEGARLVVADWDIESANQVADQVRAMDRPVSVFQVDVAKRADVEGMVQAIVKEYGRLDILINNAGINRDALSVRKTKEGEIKKMTDEQWDAVLAVNLKGTFLCAQAAAVPMMEQKYGKIVNTSSVGALGNIGQANYAASKAGVWGLTYTLALEFARYNINVNCVAPGATRTRMLAGVPENILAGIQEKIPLRRIAEPRDIANVHVFLASDEAAYITGQVIFVDGGMSVGI